MTESNQKEPLDLRALHTLYSGCTPQEKCELIERIWKLEEVVREQQEALKATAPSLRMMPRHPRSETCPSCKEAERALALADAAIAKADEILKGRQP